MHSPAVFSVNFVNFVNFVPFVDNSVDCLHRPASYTPASTRPSASSFSTSSCERVSV